MIITLSLATFDFHFSGVFNTGIALADQEEILSSRSLQSQSVLLGHLLVESLANSIAFTLQELMEQHAGYGHIVQVVLFNVDRGSGLHGPLPLAIVFSIGLRVAIRLTVGIAVGLDVIPQLGIARKAALAHLARVVHIVTSQLLNVLVLDVSLQIQIPFRMVTCKGKEE